MPGVTDAQIRAYESLIEQLAAPLVSTDSDLIELDDLMHEGRIAVWQALERGVHPAKEIIQGRMVDYVRWMRADKRGYPVKYEELLPLDDFRETVTLDEASTVLP